jgi:hypothetical protein
MYWYLRCSRYTTTYFDQTLVKFGISTLFEIETGPRWKSADIYVVGWWPAMFTFNGPKQAKI